MHSWVLPAIVASLAWAFIGKWFFQSSLADALAERIRHSGQRRKYRKGLGAEWRDVQVDGAGFDETRAAEVDDRMRALAEQVAELSERLDLTERLLAGQRPSHLTAGS